MQGICVNILVYNIFVRNLAFIDECWLGFPDIPSLKVKVPISREELIQADGGRNAAELVIRLTAVLFSKVELATSNATKARKEGIARNEVQYHSL